MTKTIIAVRHFGLGGRESLESAVTMRMRRSLENLCLRGSLKNNEICQIRRNYTSHTGDFIAK